jgi:hypothetical protein
MPWAAKRPARAVQPRAYCAELDAVMVKPDGLALAAERPRASLSLLGFRGVTHDAPGGPAPRRRRPQIAQVTRLSCDYGAHVTG